MIKMSNSTRYPIRGELLYSDSEKFAHKYKIKGVAFGMPTIILGVIVFIWSALTGKSKPVSQSIVCLAGAIGILIGLWLILNGRSVTTFQIYTKGVVVPTKPLRKMFTTKREGIFLPYADIKEGELFSRFTTTEDIKDACLLTTKEGTHYLISVENVENFPKFMELIKDKISLSERKIKNPLERLFKEK